jgi:hypothetical protein
MEDLLRVRAKTQITCDELKQETIRNVVQMIREMEGGKEVAVGAPRDRLESFFLRVVEEARAARLETAGVTVGSGAASFFGGISREEKAENILQNLLKTAEQKQAEAPAEDAGAPVVVPAAAPESQVDRQLLENLVRESPTPAAPGEGKAGTEAAGEPERPVVVPASHEPRPEEVARQTIDSLLRGKPSEEKKPDDEKAGRKDRKAER